MNLFIDTSNNKIILILEKNDSIIDSKFYNDEKRISDIFTSTLNAFLNGNNLKINDINNFYLTTGPGSYTGVRVAMTVVKTIKTINDNVGVFLISSLAYQAGINKAVSLLDARSNKWYLGVYDKGDSLIEDQLIPNDILNDFIKPFENFITLKDLNEIDFCQNYLNLKNKFIKVKDIEEMVPKYIKGFL